MVVNDGPPVQRSLDPRARGARPFRGPDDVAARSARWLHGCVTGAIALALSCALVMSVVPYANASSVAASDAVRTVIARYQGRISELMAERGVLGLAVALVDADRALWVEGFGHADGPDSAPVTPDTIFSVQSMSKLFTATVVMQLVAAGRLDLDKPITTYLPGFTVHSAFEEQPERKITLRMLLSHTAGFTHEAPVGNNKELDPGGFDAHVRSISETWLRFPVGSGYAYSNLGIRPGRLHLGARRGQAVRRDHARLLSGTDGHRVHIGSSKEKGDP